MSKFNEIPSAACVFAAPAVEFKSNGENAKSAPFELLARSAEPVEHWYWGRVVHDFDGIIGKNRIAIDYNHDPGQIIGFSNKRRVDEMGLHLSGSLTSIRPDDQADTVMKLSAMGVPYEASIFFGGNGIKIEEVPEGFTAPVNGTQFEGPGVIIRQWPLRGCAICPYGADGNTETTIFSGGKTFSAQLVTQQEAAGMPSEPDQAEAANTEETPTPAELSATGETIPETVEVTQAEAAVAAVEADSVAEVEPAAVALSVDEIKRISAEFGNDIAIQVATNGGDYTAALKLSHEAQKAELSALRAEVTKLSVKQKPTATAPASFADAEKAKNTAPKSLRKASFNISNI